MRNVVKLALAAAVMVGAGSAAAEAKLTVSNQSGHGVWFTMYNSIGQQLNAFCLPSASQRIWEGGSFGSTRIGTPGEMLYLRGEMKPGTGCEGETRSDTGRGGTIMVGQDTVKVFTVVSGRLRIG
jgi:hypothetical protein